MYSIKHKVGESLILVKQNRWYSMLKPPKGSCSSAVLSPERLVSDVGSISFSYTATGKNAVDMCVAQSVKNVVLKSGHVCKTSADPSRVCRKRKDISTIDDTFDALTYNIPEKTVVTFAEGASYSVVILVGVGIAAAAGYAILTQLIFEPKEYKIYGKALERIQNDNQVRVRIGSPVRGYGQESRNRFARRRIPNRTWTDEDGIEHVEVNFYVRGPRGAGKVYTEMFKDKVDKQWKFMYLIVEIKSPSPSQLMLESYIPA